ncbi:hypothetical protein MexAM1_META1p2526 [Methylorubrum extorquens AM1]|uniref:Uncharacterized protein n=1 Tax=Methylorubrum extorquens (strain ATCC 14718 / DSM 1338 / JCM 2805 / NCIMB 9133 / AM1) TaxID=272630 RepID=C5ARJ5_METEA|nr:hypothetical protein MexAM1_META1p2526 [Methylorubrum extorquens AM1]
MMDTLAERRGLSGKRREGGFVELVTRAILPAARLMHSVRHELPRLGGRPSLAVPWLSDDGPTRGARHAGPWPIRE